MLDKSGEIYEEKLIKIIKRFYEEILTIKGQELRQILNKNKLFATKQSLNMMNNFAIAALVGMVAAKPLNSRPSGVTSQMIGQYADYAG